MQSTDSSTIRLDVRPILSSGGKPFGVIMEAAGRVPEGGALVLDAPFDPEPLRRALADRGFSAQAEEVAAGHWRVTFRKGDPAASPIERKPGELWLQDGMAHLDVRGMQAPEPMVTILELIDSGEFPEFIVHHERDPVFLYPELEDRDWECRRLSECAGEVLLHLQRRPS